MTWQFCSNDDCPESWHWTDLAGAPEACADVGETPHDGVVVADTAA
ncbi:hypothetical protein AB0N65_01505 [Paenarthrobacter sp. NPDC089322]